MGPAPKIKAKPELETVRYVNSRLPDGLRVVTAEMPHMASVAIGIWVGVGSRHEPDPQAGIAHFIEHMLFKGTNRRSSAQISQAIEGIGGYLNAFTDEDHTCYYSRARAAYWPELLDVLMDMYLDPAFRVHEIRKEREVIKEELAMYRDQPSEHVHDLLNAVQFPNHPLGRPILGSEAALDRLRRNHFIQHINTHYVADQTVLAVAGRIRHEDLLVHLSRYCGRFRQGPSPQSTHAPGPLKGPAFSGETRDIQQANLAWGIRTCSRSDDRRFALRILNALLGENMSSRLFQSIREEHGLTYNIHSSLSSWEDAGDLTLSAGLARQELSKTLKLVQRELRRCRETLPTRGELQRARDYVIGQFELSLEGTENHMMWLGEQWSNFGTFTPPDQVKDKLFAVTPSALRSAARDFFQPDRYSLALVGPDATAEAMPRNWAV